MPAMTVEEVYERYVKPLPSAERLRLLSITALGLAEERHVRPGRKWSEIAGAAAYPLLGEDAQAWVSRGRKPC